MHAQQARKRPRPGDDGINLMKETMGPLISDESSVATSSYSFSSSQNAPATTTTLSPMAQWSKLFKREESADTASLTEATASETDFDDDMLFDSYDEDYDSEYDSDDSEEENRLVQELVRAAFHPQTVTRAPTVAKLVGKHIHPTDCLKRLVPEARFFSSHALENFFVDPVFGTTKEYSATAAYTTQMAQAVREDDVPTLQRLLVLNNSNEPPSGSLVQCGSTTPSGDSIVHIACRRNAPQVLTYLLQQGESVRYAGVVCGRTPLHDACWSTEEPNWTGIIDKLLDQCPDLLYVTDRLGATALDYIPVRHHEAACRYLEERGAEKLRARELTVVVVEPVAAIGRGKQMVG